MQLLNLLEVAGLQTLHVTEYKKHMAGTYLLATSIINWMQLQQQD